ncbi:MAG: M16 family metallopeptidase [Bacteroidota bacterium]
MINRTEKPSVNSDNSCPQIKTKSFTLNNGVPVYFIAGQKQELIRLELIFYAGSFYQEKNLTAVLTAKLLKEGTADISSSKISETLDYYGVYSSFEPQKDLVSISVFVLEEFLEPVLEILEQIIKYPSFPENELEISLKNIKQKHIVNQQKVANIARMHFGKYLFGEKHPYGKVLEMNDFEMISRNDLLYFHEKHYSPNNVFCVVSANPTDSILNSLQKHFGGMDWKNKAKVNDLKFETSDYPAPGKFFIQKKDTIQSAVRIGKRAPGMNHPDYHKLMITNVILGGYFGSRLMKKIRQEKAYTYGINSAIVSLLQESYFFISSQIGVDVTENAISDIYTEIKKLRTEKVNKAELEVVSNYLSGTFLRSFDGVINQSERLKEMIFFNLDDNHFENYLNTLQSISQKDILLTSEKYLNEIDMTELVVGK